MNKKHEKLEEKNSGKINSTNLFAILVKVVAPELISTWRIRFSNALSPSSSTRRYACAVRSLVTSFCRAHTPSLCPTAALLPPFASPTPPMPAPTSPILHLGRIRTSKPHIENSRLGLSLE